MSALRRHIIQVICEEREGDSNRLKHGPRFIPKLLQITPAHLTPDELNMLNNGLLTLLADEKNSETFVHCLKM